MLAMFDRMVDDKAALAVLAAWLRTINREDLKRRLLQSPDTTLEQIMEQAKEKIRNQGRSEEAEDDGLMPSPWGLVRPVMPPEERKAARAASKKRYTENNLAEGKCEKCPEPLDLNSTRYCTKHLACKRGEGRRTSGLSGTPSLPELWKVRIGHPGGRVAPL